MRNRFFILLFGILFLPCLFTHPVMASDSCTGTSGTMESSLPLRNTIWIQGNKAEEIKGKASIELGRTPLKKGSKRTPLQIASIQGDLNTVQDLVGTGDSLTERDVQGLNVLQLAAMTSHSKVVEFLAKSYQDQKISIDERLPGQSSALMIAAMKGHLENVKVLLKYGADANLQGHGGETALHAASSRGHLPIVNAILPYHKNLNQLDDKLRTPLHLASYFAQTEVIEPLVKGGANLNRRYIGNGFTPLHFAIYSGHLPAVEKLVALGADQTLKNKRRGELPIQLARKTNQAEIIEFLEAQKKNP